MEECPRAETQKNYRNDELIEIVMNGGPPWGFTISGGNEFGTDLFVKRVADNGIARKVGKLKEGDRLVFINDVECTSRANAIDTVKMGKSELKIKLKRNQSVEEHTVAKSCAPKRSNSFYDSVVEDMLDSVSSDISSTHYSRRRDTIRGDKGSPRRGQKSMSAVSTNTSIGELDVKATNQSGAIGDQKGSSLPSPSDESPKSRGSQLLSSSRNFQRVKVKSVKVTSMIPGVKNDISEQLKGRLEAEVRQEDSSNRTARDQLRNVKDSTKQTQSMDEGRSAWNDPLNQKKTTSSTASFASRTFHTRNTGARSESADLNVSQTKAMFEKTSRSQEMLDNIANRPTSIQRQSPTLEKKDADFTKPMEPANPAPLSKAMPSSFSSEGSGGLLNHGRTKSLPVEKFEGPRRDIRRPGTAPMRRSVGRVRPKSAHLPSEGGNSEEPQYLPLGYEAVPNTNRVGHGRKSIATCAPSTDSLYKREASFRHSSEDLRPNETLIARSERKSSTLPANQMREAAKKFHQELMKKDPKFRYSIGQMESLARPVHHGSSAGGSSSSSLNSSQDQINTVDQVRRLSNGPSVFSRACSTTSLESSPGPQETSMIAADDDNTILSRLLREQRQNNSNLVRIEEEARSPRGKTLVGSETMKSQDTIEIDEKKGRRTISIQTDFVPEVSKRGESFSERRVSDEALQPINSSVQNGMPIETCIDDVDPLFDEGTNEEATPATPPSPVPTAHAKEPSSDSIAELDEINGDAEPTLGVVDEGGEFPVTDIDALPPPPDELLIASPPEREKPQRVINRKKKDPHNFGASRNSSCVSTDSNISTSTMDSGIGVRPYSMSDSSPRNSPTTGPSEFEDDYNHGYDEGFKGSREELLEQDCQRYSPRTVDDDEQREYKENELPGDSPSKMDSSSTSSGSRSNSSTLSPRIEELDHKKATLIGSIQKKIEELKLQEQEIAEEIKLNEDLGKRVRGLVERKANQTEFSKYELFIGELNKIVALLLSLTQRLHRYEQMLQDLDMSEEEDKQKRETLVSKIDKLRSQHEEACHLREVNDRRGENVANFLDKYFNEEEFADFQYYVDMKSQLALMQSEIKEKVKLGEERYQALYSTGKF